MRYRKSVTDNESAAAFQLLQRKALAEQGAHFADGGVQLRT
jgi:hypothetical protein